MSKYTDDLQQLAASKGVDMSEELHKIIIL